MEKYKEFYFDFERNGEDFNYIFSSQEDLMGSVWKVNAKTHSINSALQVVYDIIEEDIKKWWDRLHETEKEFYNTHFKKYI